MLDNIISFVRPELLLTWGFAGLLGLLVVVNTMFNKEEEKTFRYINYDNPNEFISFKIK